jgi:rhodanese-related sulfurtransferase
MTVISRPDPKREPKRWVRRGLAALAILAAGLAVVAGDPAPSSMTAGAEAGDEVAALRLAGWIRDRRPGLRLVDLRGAAAYESDHLPGAQLPIERSPASHEETIVVYSQSNATEARERARAVQLGSVVVLRGGYEAWVAEVLNPTLPLDASTARTEEFRRVAELSRSGAWIRRGC